MCVLNCCGKIQWIAKLPSCGFSMLQTNNQTYRSANKYNYNYIHTRECMSTQVCTIHTMAEVFRRDSGCIKLHLYYKRLCAIQSRTMFVVVAPCWCGIVVIGFHCGKVAGHWTLERVFVVENWHVKNLFADIHAHNKYIQTYVCISWAFI